MQECIFCKIIKKEAPAKIEYEDEKVMAFWDINPVAPVHILIIPKKHILSLKEIENKDLNLIAKMIWVAIMISKKKGVFENGFRLVVNTGKWAGQIVPHLHLHLLGGKK